MNKPNCKLVRFQLDWNSPTDLIHKNITIDIPQRDKRLEGAGWKDDSLYKNAIERFRAVLPPHRVDSRRRLSVEVGVNEGFR